MDMKMILNGIYRDLINGETVPIKPEYVSTVLNEMISRGLVIVRAKRPDGRVDFKAAADAEPKK